MCGNAPQKGGSFSNGEDEKIWWIMIIFQLYLRRRLPKIMYAMTNDGGWQEADLIKRQNFQSTTNFVHRRRDRLQSGTYIGSTFKGVQFCSFESIRRNHKDSFSFTKFCECRYCWLSALFTQPAFCHFPRPFMSTLSRGGGGQRGAKCEPPGMIFR